VDAVKTVAAWDDASMTQFTVGPGWNVRVFAKHAARYLYFDGEGVRHAGTRLFPEILLDPRNAKSPVWQKGPVVAGCFQSFMRRQWRANRV
jgi:hypothetical protein